jgi:hypothetical protein
MINQKKLDEILRIFAETLSKQQLGLVYHIPDENSKATDCLANVRNYIKKKGGQAKFGWTFIYRISQYGGYLFATHHSVWLKNDGTLIDITPFHPDIKHKPLTINGSVIFLLDDNAVPLEKGEYIIPRPLRFFPVDKNKELKQYLETLKDKEYRYYIDSFDIDIDNLFNS